MSSPLLLRDLSASRHFNVLFKIVGIEYRLIMYLGMNLQGMNMVEASEARFLCRGRSYGGIL